MPNEKRLRLIQIRMTDSEINLIKKKMKAIGMQNLSAYIRTVAMNGYVLNPDFSEVKELIPSLRNMTNNINQIAQRVNAGGTVYETELDEIKDNQQTIWNTLKSLLKKLTKLK